MDRVIDPPSLSLPEAFSHMRGIKIGIYSAGQYRTSELHIGIPFGCGLLPGAVFG
jgi:hypothetical protein